jgi:uncharacterized protein (DUF1330 family)
MEDPSNFEGGFAMPAGYTITRITVTDREKYKEYARGAFPTMKKYGCEVLVDDKETEILEGDWKGERTIILKWPSRQAALDWYNDPDYQAVVGARHEGAETDFVLVEGLGD